MPRTRVSISPEGDYISGHLRGLIKALSALPVDNFRNSVRSPVSWRHEN